MIIRQHFFHFYFIQSQRMIIVQLSNSSGYSRSTFKIQPFELFLVYLFKLNPLESIHLNLFVGGNLDTTLLYKLFASKYIICFDSCLGSEDFKYLLLAFLYLLEIEETSPRITFSRNKFMSRSGISSGSTFVILSAQKMS